MRDGIWELAIWVFIFVVITIVTWVRKSIERAKSEARPGQQVDVGAAVRAQIDRYLGVLGQGRGPGSSLRDEQRPPPSPPPRPTPPPRPAAREEPAPRRRPGDRAPEVEPAGRRRPVAPAFTSTLAGRYKDEKLPDLRRRTAARIHLDRGSVRTAVVLAEVLGPPVAERPDYRLF